MVQAEELSPKILPISTLNNDSETRKEEIKKEMESEREKIKNEIDAKRLDLKTKMETLKESIKNEKNTSKAKVKEDRIIVRENALARFDKMVSNMVDLKNKINTQIAYFDTKKVDTTGAKVFITTGEIKLNDVESKIVEAHALLSTSLNELTSDEKTTLQNLNTDIQNLINEIHNTLDNAVKSLKDSLISKK